MSDALRSLPYIKVAQPSLRGNEAKYVAECLETGWISSVGRFVTEFEEAFARYCGVKHAVATNNGTTALHLALIALDLAPGDEVIVPTLTYVASANAVKYCGGTPILIDCEPSTFNLDPTKLESKLSSRTRGIIPVHLYGHPVDMDRVTRFAEKHKLFVMEDAAEAVGATYKGRLVGSIGSCSTFSFFGNKIITTGEGGMVTTNDDQLADRLRLYRGQGMDPKRRYWFPVIGYNYRMTNIAAAIGLAQLERIDDHLKERKRVAKSYDAGLKHLVDRLILPQSELWASHSYWMYTVLLRDGDDADRDRVMKELDQLGIETRPVFYPMHVMPPYFERLGLYPVAESCAKRGINLPTFTDLNESQIARICDALTTVLK